MPELTDYQADVASVRDLGIEFRGLAGGWPRALTPAAKRKHGGFKADFPSTIRLLKHELRQIHAENVRVQLAMDDAELRLDGIPRKHAKPAHPGVILSFDKPGAGRLVYPCDTFRRWDVNLRAIALTLEALRRPLRYGVLQAGEQYAGNRLLTAGGTATTMTAQAAAEYLARWCAASEGERAGMVARLLREASLVDPAYRQAARALHPDTAADDGQRRARADLMDKLTKARTTLRAHHGLGRKDDA